MIYTVPVHLLNRYPNDELVIRIVRPEDIVALFSGDIPDNALGLSLPITVLGAFETIQDAPPIPLDIVVEDSKDFPELYKLTELVRSFPIRVTARAQLGFSKVVRLAASLNLPVKIELTPPEPRLIEELTELARYYLFQSTLNQPIEYFHSTLVGFLRADPVSLWLIQEEDPAFYQYVDDSGETRRSGLLPQLPFTEEMRRFIQDPQSATPDEFDECIPCRYVSPCRGYFKLPDPTYNCDGVKSIFALLEETAAEIQAVQQQFDQKVNP